MLILFSNHIKSSSNKLKQSCSITYYISYSLSMIGTHNYLSLSKCRNKIGYKFNSKSLGINYSRILFGNELINYYNVLLKDILE
jgi:hypothetical protein